MQYINQAANTLIKADVSQWFSLTGSFAFSLLFIRIFLTFKVYGPMKDIIWCHKTLL